MHLPIPFTLGSDTTHVHNTRPPYCHHHHSASADSTEYWIWNGPDQDDEEDVEDDDTEETAGSCQPRPEQNESFDDAPSLLSLQDDSETYSFSSDPTESFSPLLRQSWQTLDLPYASSSSPRGLGLFNLTRNNDASRPFDGLGRVRVRSSRQREEEDEDELSSTFLNDLEAFFLVKDFGQPSFEAPTIRVEDSPTEEQLVAPPTSPVTPSPSHSSLTSKIKHALRPRAPSMNTTSVLPTSISTSTVSASTSTSSMTSVSSTSSFIRRTCSAFRSQYNLNALRAEHAAETGSPSTSPVKGKRSPNKSGETKRTGLLQPVPLTGPARKVSVSVSMGDGNTSTPVTPMKSDGKRSLQTHCVRDSKDWRDVRDLSVMGTISSGLKKRERK